MVVCVGPGGVGKTTTAAALALRGARAGLRACVVTIDPARRLADALGMSGVGNEPHLVPAPGGSLAGRAVGGDARRPDHLRRPRGPLRD